MLQIKNMTESVLAEYITDLCCLAQSHLREHEMDDCDLALAMEATSFQVACLLANYTQEGHAGVDWNVVHEDLCDMTKTPKDWDQIAWNLIASYGGIGQC